MNKILSIIIPTYNMEKYLRKCLDSLIVSDENMERLEVLVINDGSKDFSSQIGHEYESKYPQTFRVIDKENGNYGSCINRGLKEATGKYVKVLDADDYSNAKDLDNYLTFLKETDADAIITSFNIVDINGTITDKRDFSAIFDKGETIVSFPDLLRSTNNIAFQMHAITYRLNMVQEMGYKQTEGISYTDQEWSTIPMTRVKTICYYHHSVYNYLIGREGQTMATYLDVTNHKQLFLIVQNISLFFQESNYEHIYNIYVREKLKKVLSGIYLAGLKFNSISIAELEQYDGKLKSFPEAYKLANELKLISNHINYVRHWRSGSIIRQFLFIMLPLKLRRIIKKIKYEK